MPARSGVNETESAEVIGEMRPTPGLPSEETRPWAWLTVICGTCNRNIAMHSTLVMLDGGVDFTPCVTMLNYDGDDRGQVHRCAGE
jgi:hypothetical protein